ncbi:hypothetical protein PYW07_010177 [Mythimna separata]|uniref:Major facilitator superfamily (MFS) profile domain-containing protein n=1 Tax=Mythimna separata TaxID=271217 RepID=A0AAD7YH14_MYTSE|nr:hypothetical protein PYW07_010177 [Mythimna separata]
MGAKTGEVNTSIRKQFVIAACLYLGQFLVGYVTGWTAPVLAKLQNEEETPLASVIDDAQSSWVGSLMALGAIFGPYISGYLCNVIGRKPGLYIGGSISLLAFVILALATHLYIIYLGRILTGVGGGILFVMNLVYIGEMASTRIRGTMLTLTGVFNTLGILFAYSVGPFVPYSVISWLAAALYALYLVAVFFFVTETAVYQVMKGRKDDAMANLTSLGRQDDIDEIVAKANDKPKSNMAQLTEMYTVRSNRMATFIIISLNMFQQLSGVIAVMSFVTIIFDMTESNLEPHISTIIIGVTQVVAAVFAPLVVDRSGRRILLLVSTAGCSLSLTALGIYFYLLYSGHPLADDLQWLALVSIMLFFLSYFSGFGIIPNAFIGEMFTDTCRGFGGTFTVTVGWVVGFGIQSAFGYMLIALGPYVTFWIFAVNLGQFMVGYGTGWTAPILAKLQNEEDTPLESVIDDAQSSWVGSLMALGAIIGPYLSGYLCNIIGRKPCLYIGGSIYLMTFVILAFAKHLFVIYLGRILIGVSVGIIFVMNLVYIGEMASTRIRGTMLTLTGLSNTIGILFAYSVGPFVPYSAINWIGAAINGLYLVTVFLFVTETAVYQVMKGRREEAMANLTSLGRQDDIDEIVAKANDKPKSNMAQLTEMYTAALGIYFYLLYSGHPAAETLQWMALVSIMLFFLSYFGGFGIIPNTFIGEMFTDTCRGFGGTFTVTVGWLVGFGVQSAFGYMLIAWGPYVTFWIFAGFCALAFVFSVIFVPETKGKSLLEIQEFLGKRAIF